MRYFSLGMLWLSMAIGISVSSVACSSYNTELERIEFEKWKISRNTCVDKGGIPGRSWGNEVCNFEGSQK